MEIKTGVDIIEIKRVKESIESTNKEFCKRVYTDAEIKFCENKKNQKYQHYAARFAGKEAVFKAISSILENKYEISWKDIEILNYEDGKPYVKIPEKYMKKIGDIDISISHCKEYAIANVVVIINS